MSEEDDVKKTVQFLWRCSQNCAIESVAYYVRKISEATRDYPDARIRFEFSGLIATPLVELGEKKFS